jgi:hypothetical protein
MPKSRVSENNSIQGFVSAALFRCSYSIKGVLKKTIDPENKEN